MVYEKYLAVDNKLVLCSILVQKNFGFEQCGTVGCFVDAIKDLKTDAFTTEV